MSLNHYNSFSNPFVDPQYREQFCKPNSTKIDGSRFWSILRERHAAHPPQEWPELGIRFKRFAVLPLGEINITKQFARVFVTESDHVSLLEHSFLQRGWDVDQPLVAVGSTAQIQKVCPRTFGEMLTISEEHIGVVGKHRITALRNLMRKVWVNAASDPHDWRTVFTHILVAVYEYESPTSFYAHDLLTNNNGLPAKSTAPKDVENAMRDLFDRGCLTNLTPDGRAMIDALIEKVSPHLRERDRRNIKNQYQTTVVTKRGESIRPIASNQKRLDEVKAKVFTRFGVPQEKRYLTEDGRLTRPFSKGLVAWSRRYEEQGETTPVVVAGYLPLTKTTEKTHTTLAEVRRKMQQTATEEIEDHAAALITLFEYVRSKTPKGRTWESLDRSEQTALMLKWFPVRFVDFVAQNDAPNPNAHGMKMEPDHTLVTNSGKISVAIKRCGYPAQEEPQSAALSAATCRDAQDAQTAELLTRIFTTDHTLTQASLDFRETVRK